MPPAMIPRPVLRRLTLALLGWRFDGTAWHRDGQTLTEEALDAMTPAQWGRYVRRWLTSATAN